MGFKNFINTISETYPLTLSGLLEKKLFLWVKSNTPTIVY
jgi:hypothetical protein